MKTLHRRNPLVPGGWRCGAANTAACPVLPARRSGQSTAGGGSVPWCIFRSFVPGRTARPAFLCCAWTR